MTPALAAALVLAALTAGRAAVAAGRGRRVVARLDGGRRRPAAPAGAVTRGPLAVPPWLARRLAAADVGAPPAAVWHAWLAGGAVVVLGGLAAGGPTAGAMAAAASAGGPLAALAAARDRGARRLEAALPEALEAVARSLRGGASVPAAVAEAAAGVPGTLGSDLRTVAAAVDGGERLEAALDAWAAARPLPGVRLAVAALAVATGTGGAPARAVDGVAATLRARLAVAGEVRALSSQARASAFVIAVAPVAFMALAASSDARTAAFLFRSPAGLACLAAGVLLDGAGALWMHRVAGVDPW